MAQTVVVARNEGLTPVFDTGNNASNQFGIRITGGDALCKVGLDTSDDELVWKRVETVRGRSSGNAATHHSARFVRLHVMSLGDGEYISAVIVYNRS